MTLDIAQARANMIAQQIRPWHAADDTVLEVLNLVPREDFVPEAYRSLAFTDVEIPLSDGEIMLKPNLQARILNILDVQADDKILEIGTGTGYMTACLATLGLHVDSVDINATFTAVATANLVAHDIDNVQLITADASKGWGEEMTYDVIVVTGSMPEASDHFARRLKTGGRLLMVIGNEPAMTATLTTRVGQNEFEQEGLFETVIPPLKNTEIPVEFSF